MDNPNPDSTTNANPDEPDARQRRDAGLPAQDEEEQPSGPPEDKKNIV